MRRGRSAALVTPHAKRDHARLKPPPACAQPTPASPSRLVPTLRRPSFLDCLAPTSQNDNQWSNNQWSNNNNHWSNNNNNHWSNNNNNRWSNNNNNRWSNNINNRWSSNTNQWHAEPLCKSCLQSRAQPGRALHAVVASVCPRAPHPRRTYLPLSTHTPQKGYRDTALHGLQLRRCQCPPAPAVLPLGSGSSTRRAWQTARGQRAGVELAGGGFRAVAWRWATSCARGCHVARLRVGPLSRSLLCHSLVSTVGPQVLLQKPGPTLFLQHLEGKRNVKGRGVRKREEGYGCRARPVFPPWPGPDGPPA